MAISDRGIPVHALVLAGLLLAITSAAKGQSNMLRDHRLGFIGISFDDGNWSHYVNAFPIMEKYRVKGVFAVCAGGFAREPGGRGCITGAQCQELYRAGHEIMDHTWRHESGIWSDAGTVEQWTQQTEASLAVFKALGVTVRGWNLPGGASNVRDTTTGQMIRKDSVYTRDLQSFLRRHYDYSRGYTDSFGNAPFNLCWNFRGDPHYFSGVYSSWESVARMENGRTTRENAEAAVRSLKTSRADALQRGVYVGFCFHEVTDEKHSRWALEELCRWIAENDLPNTTYGQAIDAFRNPRKFYPEDIEQIPCADFQYDLDGNGRPDGWEGCAFAPEEVKGLGKSRVAQFRDGTTAYIYGPERGETRISFQLRSPDGQPVKGRLQVTGVDVLDQHARSPRHTLAEVGFEAGGEWREVSATFPVAERNEHCAIRFSVDGDRPVRVTSPSWRRVKK
ncbi:MAG: polysaccharide deacetylase family protein [Armatimonadetes bacterium]|nr:polysaccharide deacetylase family protein [Armatimonadota bacterium]